MAESVDWSRFKMDRVDEGSATSTLSILMATSRIPTGFHEAISSICACGVTKYPWKGDCMLRGDGS